MRADSNPTRGMAIDPFGAVPYLASGAADLRGGDVAPEPDYLFRTLPVAVPFGAATFVVRFDGATGHDASIFFDLTSSDAERSDVPVRDRTLIVPVEDIVASGGTASLAFEAHPGLLYALAGYLQGSGAFGAAGLAIELTIGRSIDANGVEPVELPRLTALDHPSMADPVSQPRTRHQLRSAEYRAWAQRLSLGDASEDRRWALAYVAQVLTRYGAVRPDAWGVSLDVVGHPLLCLFDVPAENDFADCAWWIRSTGDRQAVADTVWTLLDRVKPGGLVVVVFDYCSSGGISDALDRPAIERVALDLVAAGHGIGQLKFRSAEAAPADAPIAFGLIARRSLPRSDGHHP